MSTYMAIEAVSTALTAIVRRATVPSLIKSDELVGFSNHMTAKDFALNINLYGINLLDPAVYGLSADEYMVLALRYAIAASASSENNYKASAEQLILGKVMQAFAQEAVLYTVNGDEQPPVIKYDNITFDERVRLNNTDLLLFYQVSPVIFRTGVTGGDGARRVMEVV